MEIMPQAAIPIRPDCDLRPEDAPYTPRNTHRPRQLSIFCVHLAVKWGGDHYGDIKHLTVPLNQRINEIYLRRYFSCEESRACKDHVEITLTDEFYQMLSDVVKVRFQFHL